MSPEDSERLRRKLKREQVARRRAEDLLEEKSRELYLANQTLEARVHSATLELQRHADLLGLAMRTALLASWEWEIAGDVIRFDEHLPTLLGSAECPIPSSRQAWYRLIDPRDAPDVRAAHDRCATSIGSEYETRYLIRPAGASQARRIHERGVSASIDGKITVVAILHDCTESESLREELRQRRAELDRRSHLAMIGEIGSSIAHEINQPLASISNYASAASRILANEPSAPKDAITGLGRVSELALIAADRIRSIRRMLGQSVESDTPVDGATAIRHGIDAYRAEDPETDASLRTDLSASATIRADATLIDLIMINLLRNSATACAKRPVSIMIRTAVDAGRFVCEVIDDGPGIPTESERQAIFEPLVTGTQGGTGLGLSICRNAVEAMHGTIRCLEPVQPATGARFRIEFPIEAGS